jgi:hypothetical protein
MIETSKTDAPQAEVGKQYRHNNRTFKITEIWDDSNTVLGTDAEGEVVLEGLKSLQEGLKNGVSQIVNNQ